MGRRVLCFGDERIGEAHFTREVRIRLHTIVAPIGSSAITGQPKSMRIQLIVRGKEYKILSP